MKYKFWNIELDGPDKVGKSTLGQYLTLLSNYRFAMHDRGYMTQVAYAKKFNRQFEYSEPDRNTIYILLTVEPEEHAIRCKIHNEPKIDYEKDAELFKEVFYDLSSKGYLTMTFNTSHMSTYELAKEIIKRIDRLEALND